MDDLQNFLMDMANGPVRAGPTRERAAAAAMLAPPPGAVPIAPEELATEGPTQLRAALDDLAVPPAPPGALPIDPSGEYIDNSSFLGDLKAGALQFVNDQITGRRMAGAVEDTLLRDQINSTRPPEDTAPGGPFANEAAGFAEQNDAARALIEELAPVYNDRARAIAEIPLNPRAQRVLDPAGDTFLEKAGNAGLNFLRDPGGTARTFAVRSAPNMAPTVAATVAGSALGGPLGGALAGGAAGADTEYTASMAQGIVEAMQDARVDMADGAAVADFLTQNPEAMATIRSDAAVRAAVIGGMDAITGGLTGKLAKTAQGGTRAKRVKAVAQGAGIGAVSEGAGEGLAMRFTGDGTVNPGEMLAESVGGGAMTGPQTALQIAGEGLRSGKTPEASPPATPPTPEPAPEAVPFTPAPPEGAVPLEETPAPPEPVAATPPPPEGAVPIDPEPAAPPTEQVAPPTEQVAPEPTSTEPAPAQDPDYDPAVFDDYDERAGFRASEGDRVADANETDEENTGFNLEADRAAERVLATGDYAAFAEYEAERPATAEALRAVLAERKASASTSTEPTSTEPTSTEPTPPEPASVGPTPDRSDRVYDSKNREYEVEYTVAEADDLLTSEDDGYNMSLQPRDRAARAESELQIEGVANAPNPRRLHKSPEIDRGSPITGLDGGTVEAGNGRVAGLRRAYERGTAAEYRAYVEENFPEAKGMRAPVLVRRRLTGGDAVDFAAASNVSATMQMSDKENARADAKAVDDKVMFLYRPGPITSGANRDMVREFLGRLPSSERNALVTDDGQPSQAGIRRFEAALFTRAFGQNNLLSRLTEKLDDDVRAVTNTLVAVAPRMAALQLAINRGEVSEEVDIAPEVLAATEIMADIKARGQDLVDYRNQIDAFAEPNDPVTDAILDAFWNDKGTRTASKTAMQDFLNDYITRAMAQKVDQETLPGVEAAPVKGREELINETEQARDNDKAQPALFEGATGGRSPRGQRAQKRSAARRESRAKATGREQLKDARPSQAPADPDAPDFMDVATTDSQTDGPASREAYRAAGHDPAVANNFPPERKVSVLSKLLASTFGFAQVGRAKGMVAIEAVDQLLDAHRGVRNMLAALNLPLEALGLEGTLSLSLERFKGAYLGMYDSATRTIHMPGRSTSFAHEWMHALDHFLAAKLTPTSEEYLLSRAARDEGLDPNESIQAAYVNLINAMFYDDAALGLRMLQLERDANKTDKNGAPLKKAIKAREELAKLAAGNSGLKIQPSAYRADAVTYNPKAAGYFASVHELLARAFEAYIAHRSNDGSGRVQPFVSSGDRALRSTADRRLRMTMPKAGDRAAIFDAFDTLFDHLRAQALLGGTTTATRETGTDLLDPVLHPKMILGASTSGEVRAEYRRVMASLGELRRNPKAALRNTASRLALNMGMAKLDGETTGAAAGRAFTRASDATRWLVSSMRGVAKRYVAREPKEAQPVLEWLLRPVMNDPGTGKAGQTPTVEEATERTTNRLGSDIYRTMKKLGLGDDLSDADGQTVRSLMYDSRSTPGASKGLVQLADFLRLQMDAAYRRAVKAGLEMGYIDDTGYLPRVLNVAAVERDRAGFVAKATEVYGIQFDNMVEDMDSKDLLSFTKSVENLAESAGVLEAERKALRAAEKDLKEGLETLADDATADVDVDALEQAVQDARETLLEAARPLYSESRAERWMVGALAGEATTFDTLGPGTNFKKTRTLPKQADQLLTEFYETDPIDLVANYVRQTTKRAEYQKAYGTSGGVRDFATLLLRREVKEAIAANPGKYNKNTIPGRFAILQDLADHTKDDLKALGISLATKAGASGQTTGQIKSTIEAITGRSATSEVSAPEKLASAVYVAGTISLLARSALTSLAEPITVLLRTGDVRTSMHTFGAYLNEARRGAKSVQELERIAEMVGIVSSPLSDAVMMNRMGGDNDNAIYGSTILMRFFRANLLSQLTNSQRRAVLRGGTFWLSEAARTWRAGGTDKKAVANRNVIAAELRDLGVQGDALADFVTWMADLDGLPTEDQMREPMGAIYADVLGRFVDQTIQNPRRADKVQAAVTSPMGRIAFSLTSFIFTFYRNVHVATALRTKRDFDAAKRAGYTKREAQAFAAQKSAVSFVGGFAALYTAQLLVGMARSALFDREEWEKREGDDEVFKWQAQLAFSRSGALGPLDILYNAHKGLRYDRDLTALSSGAYLGYFMSQTQNMLGVLSPRNTPNSDTAEYRAAQSAYRMFAAPVLAAGVAAIPAAGPVGAGLRAAALMGATSNTSASSFAGVFFDGPNKD